MGIFQKLSTLLRSNINDAIVKAENPEKMLNQIILDMREQLGRAKQEVAVAIADERKLRAQVDKEREQAAEWENRAILAVNQDRDDLAKQALMRHQEHAERAVSMEETWARQAEETGKLKTSLRQLNDKIEEAKRKRNLLVAKQKRAQAQKRIHQTMSGLADRSAFETFERVAERIEDAERRTLAAGEVQRSLTGDTLEKQFATLEGEDALDDRLLALKQRLGKALPAETEPAKQLKPAHVEEGEVREAELEKEE